LKPSTTSTTSSSHHHHHHQLTQPWALLKLQPNNPPWLPWLF
jgi:hypothetical protein